MSRQGNAFPLRTRRGLALLACTAIAGGAIAAALAAEPGGPAGPEADLNADPRAVYAGGEGTTFRDPTRNAFSHPMTNLAFADRAAFNIGNAVFRRPWVVAPSSTRSSDGLGPIYNARACQHCHMKDGRGHPPAANFPDDTAQSILVRLSVPPGTPEEEALLASGRVNSLPDPVYGGQLQDLGIPGVPAEGHLWTDWTEVPVTLADGEMVFLREPAYRIADPAYGPLHPDVMLSVRVAPQMIGLGLLEAIPEAAILALADPEDTDSDGISGRANRVDSALLGERALGRFGWKASVATLAEQNAGAFSGDIGMSTSLVPAAWGDCTETQAVCRNAIHGTDDRNPVEVADPLMEALLFYTRTLAVPARRDFEDPTAQRGAGLFSEAGCAGCHQPSFETSATAAHPALAGQQIWPYTDLLLHDMGEGLADNRPDGLASGREWRTAPLWGIGLTEAVSGHSFFLHDGRARNLTEAILWHGGEAQAARDVFAGMPAADRAALIRFLESL